MPDINKRVLSSAQFAAAGNAPGGGASRRVNDSTEAPKRGYFVSSTQPEVVDDAPTSAAVIEAHRELIKRTHRTPNFQGIWNSGDAETGEQGPVFIDHSNRFLHPQVALGMAEHGKQLSLYDADADTVRDTKDPNTDAWAARHPKPKR